MSARGERWAWSGPDWNERGKLRVYGFTGREVRTFIMEIEDCDGDFAYWRVREPFGDRPEGLRTLAEGQVRDTDEAARCVRAAMNGVLGYDHFNPDCGRPADQEDV